MVQRPSTTCPRLPVLRNEPGHLGARQPLRLANLLAYRTLARPPEPAVPNAPDDLVDVVPFPWAVIGLLFAFQEGIDPISGAFAFDLRCHDHAPMIAQTACSRSSSFGNARVAQADIALDNHG